MDNVPYQTTVVNALGKLYDQVITFIPNIIAAIIVLILGWILASFLSKLIYRFLEIIQIDRFANQLGLKELSARTGRHLSFASLGAWLVKWFFFLGSFIAASEVLKLNEVTTFLYDQVLPFAGHVVVAMAILLLGILAANFLSDLVKSVVKASGIYASQALGSITKWVIIFFTVIAALTQLGIAAELLQDLFRAIVAMLAIAGGLAFGLGGRDHAKKILDHIEQDLTKRE